MTRREKQWRRILSTSLLDATVPSDEVSSKSDCENRTGKIKFWFDIRHAGSWLGRSPFRKSDIKTVENWMQVRPGDQPGYPKDTIESFVGHSSMGLLCPPAEIDTLGKH